MEYIFIFTTNSILTERNIFKTYSELSAYYQNKDIANFCQLCNLRADIRNFDKFILERVRKSTQHNVLAMLKENKNRKIQLTKLINNKFKSM